MWFKVDDQEQPNWCWAAVALSIERYFSPSTSLTQCKLASQVLGLNCCADPTVCDWPQKLQDALWAVGRLRAVIARPLAFDELQLERAANLPVCAGIDWGDGAGHFVVIINSWVSPRWGPMVRVEDSLYSDQPWTYDDFLNRYQWYGRWTGTYLVKP